MADKFRTDIILIISSRRGIVSVAIGGRGIGGTNEVTVLIVIIVFFRNSTIVVVAAGIVIGVVFGIISIVDGNIIVGVAFGRSIRLASGWDTAVVIILERNIMVVVVGIIINVVFGIVIFVVVVVVVVNCKGPTLNPAVRIIIVGVSDEAKGPIISGVRDLDAAVGTVIVML